MDKYGCTTAQHKLILYILCTFLNFILIIYRAAITTFSGHFILCTYYKPIHLFILIRAIETVKLRSVNNIMLHIYHSRTVFECSGWDAKLGGTMWAV